MTAFIARQGLAVGATPVSVIDTAGNVTGTTIAKISGTSSQFLKADGSVDSSTYITAIGVTTANGVSGSSSGGATPNLTIALGAITPSSVAANGNITSTGNINGASLGPPSYGASDEWKVNLGSVFIETAAYAAKPSFRFDQDFYAYADKLLTVTAPAFSAGELTMLFGTPNGQAIDLFGKTSPIVITISGGSFGASSYNKNRMYVSMHQNSLAGITNLQMEVYKNAAYTSIYNQTPTFTVGNTVLSPYDGVSAYQTGARWTITFDNTQHIYIHKIGCMNINETAWQWNLTRSGGTVFGAVKIQDSTTSTNTTTGALVVSGGVGIGGALFGVGASFSGTVSSSAAFQVNNASNAIIYLNNTNGTGKLWQLNSYSDGSLLIGINGVGNYLNFASTGAVTVNTTLSVVKTTTTFRTTDSRLLLDRVTPSTDSTVMRFGGGVAVDYLIGRQANNDDLVFGTDTGAAFTERARISATGVFTCGNIPASGGGTTNFLRADGSWAAPTATVTTTDDVATATSVYPVWQITGAGSNALKVSTTYLSYTPSTSQMLITTGAAGGTPALIVGSNGNVNQTGKVEIRGANAKNKFVVFSTGTTARWVLGTDVVSESGSNAGSGFALGAYADDGTTLIDTPITIARLAGSAITFARPLYNASTQTSVVTVTSNSIYSAGGLGIVGQIYVTNSTASTTTTSGAVVISGGIVGAKSIVATGTHSNSPASGAQSVTIDPSVGNYILITGNASGTAITLANPSYSVAGQSINIKILHGTTASTLASVGSQWKFAGGNKTLSTTTGAIDMISAVYDGAYWLACLAKGFA